MLEVDLDKCTGCSLCVPACPVKALAAWGKVQVDHKLCNDCLECVPHCPLEALKEK